MTTIDDQLNSIRQDAERDAQPIDCAHCGERLMDRADESRVPPAMVEHGGDQYCSDDCYRDWCETQAWAYERLIGKVNAAMRSAEQDCRAIQETANGLRDHELLCSTDPRHKGDPPYGYRFGRICSDVRAVTTTLACIGNAEPRLYRPSIPLQMPGEHEKGTSP